MDTLKSTDSLAADAATEVPDTDGAPLPARQVIGPYQLLALLGKGGMGEVFLAEDTRLGRRVALKFLPANFTADDTRLRRFVQEAKTASALNHPNIVTIYDIGETAEGRFIAMEFIEGRTLRQLSKQRPAIESVVKIVAQTARALANAHGASIIHRDIKPDNIMVRGDGYVKVLDFGLARLNSQNLADSTAETAFGTAPGVILGTVAYMSPEQARGESTSGATDVFSLGIVLYELLTGHHPFSADSQIGLLHSIVSHDPVPPARLNPEVPAGIEALVMRMLEKDSSVRPAAAEVEAVLSAASGRSAVQAASGIASANHRSVGRQKERTELHEVLEAVARGRGSFVAISGEPGIGKTTIVEDFIAELQASGKGFSIARGRCSERLAGSEAYLPFLEALESLLHTADGSFARTMRMVAPTWYAQIVPLLPDNASDARVIADIKLASQERLKRELSALFEEAARKSLLILFIDDLHWADESTIDLLAYLAGKFDVMRLLVLATYRPSDLLLARHPFLQVKLDMQARGLCREIALEFLNPREVERYLAQEFPENQFPAGLSELIHARTEGSPLFVADLMRYLRDRKVIVREQDRWLLSRDLSDIRDDLPQSVLSMIQRKIDQLEEEDRRLLVAASVQGNEFDSAVVSKVLGLDAAEVEERLAELDRVYSFVQLLDEAEFPDRTIKLRYRFVHALYQNAFYGSLKPTRRAALSAAVAGALIGYHRDQASRIASQLAFLFEAARDFAQGANFFLVAARNATQLFANREAVKLARRGLDAVAALEPGAERDQKELSLQLALVMPLVALYSHGSDDAVSAFVRVRDLCERLGENRFLFHAHHGLYWGYHSRGERDRAWNEIETMFEIAERTGDSGQLMQACFIKGTTLYQAGKYALARAQLERAVALHDPQLHAAHGFIYGIDPGLYGRTNLARCLWCMGYPDQDEKLTLEALRMAARSPHTVSRCLVLMDATRMYTIRRDTRTVRDLAEEIIALSTQHEVGLLPWGTMIRGYALAVEGQVEEGISQMIHSLDEIRAFGMKTGVSLCLLMLAGALNDAGRVDEGLEAVDEAFETIQSTGEHLIDPELHRLRGELLLKQAASEDASSAPANTNVENPLIAEAEDRFVKAIEIAREQGARSVELRAAMSLARLHEKQDRSAESRGMLRDLYSSFTEGFDTPDLIDAARMLGRLSNPNAT